MDDVFEMKRNGIKFYSAQDMSCGWNLRESEKFFQHWDENTSDPDINTILELYNIKKFFDVDMRLKEWTDRQFAEYKNKRSLIPGILGRFCSTISNANIEIFYKTVEWNYTDDFWQLICDYRVFRRISVETMESLLDCDENTVWHILGHRPLVTAFGQVIADHLVDDCCTAEELISHFLEAHEHSDHPLHFPTEFTQEMRDKVLMDYVEREDGNTNFLYLLEQAQGTKEFPVSDKLKLKARKKKEELQEKIFGKKTGFSYGAEVAFKSIPDGSIEETYCENIIKCAYSREWIEENLDYPTLMNNFIYLFKYVDHCFRCRFISLHAELGVFERHLGVKGKKDYMHGIEFSLKQITSLLQMEAYNQELRRLDIQLEDIFKWFFKDYLKIEFNAGGFTYSPPSIGTTCVEKCKLLAISIDGVLKQFRLFCEDGFIDRELLEISSEHILFNKIGSLLKNKYAYSNSDKIRSEMFLLVVASKLCP